MKNVLIFITIIYFQKLTFSQTSEVVFKKVDTFLIQYISSGLVDYKLVKENINDLNVLVEELGTLSPSSDKEKKAQLINLYNLSAIKLLAENYPISSPQEISNFYDKKFISYSHSTLSLNDIENDIIRKEFKDPRVHFVLVCGALGCPPITNFAYTTEKLEEQLNNQTKLSLNNDDFIKVNSEDKKVSVSEIFKWYEADFKQNGSTVIGFINKYRENKIPEDYKVDYYTYDWSLNEIISNSNNEQPFDPTKNVSNVQAYTPSVLLKKNQFEIQFFNNLYTQTAYRNNKQKLIDLHERASYYSGLIQFNYGVSKSSRINVGMDINLKSVRIDTNESKSTLNLFRFENTIYQRTALASLGPKIKISPFKRQTHFSIQSAFWIPVAKDLEADTIKKPWLDYNRYTWWNQFFFDKSIGKKFQIFTEADLLFRFAKDSTKYAFNKKKTSSLSIPVSLFLSYFPTKKSTLYGMIQYAPTFGKVILDNNGAPTKYYYVSSFYSQFGFGGKYQLTSHFSIELLYTNFFASMNGGAGQTYNLGIKYLR